MLDRMKIIIVFISWHLHEVINMIPIDKIPSIEYISELIKSNDIRFGNLSPLLYWVFFPLYKSEFKPSNINLTRDENDFYSTFIAVFKLYYSINILLLRNTRNETIIDVINTSFNEENITSEQHSIISYAIRSTNITDDRFLKIITYIHEFKLVTPKQYCELLLIQTNNIIDNIDNYFKINEITNNRRNDFYIFLHKYII
jgi:hypothetical protein